MIIAAYAGTGKSTFAAQVGNTVDLPIMPYRWILPPTDKPPAELEGEKGALYRLPDPRFPLNYLAEILKTEKTYEFVLIPTNLEVIRRLQEDYGRKVLICCPEDACREEYRERFAARGNSESFLELFIDGWDSFLNPVRENKQGVQIVMGPGEYLTDLRQRFEAERRTDTAEPVSDDMIHILEEKAAAYRSDSALHLYGPNGSCIYPIMDLDAPEEREFLHQIGQMIFDSGIYPMIALKGCLRSEALHTNPTSGRGDVKAFVEKYRHAFFEG